MRLRALAASTLVATAAVPFLALTATAAPPGDPDPAKKCTVQPPVESPYLCANVHLGPAVLPRTSPVATLVEGYDPLGPTLKDVAFLSRYSYMDGVKFRWRYPPFDGFAVHRVNGEDYPLKKPLVLRPGAHVDRFGGPSGRYLSPAGTSYAARALPPDALNTPGGGPPANYYCYTVTRSFTVDSGPAAAAFEQPGGALQYHLAYDPADPKKPAKTRVEDLTGAAGYLNQEKDPNVCKPA